MKRFPSLGRNFTPQIFIVFLFLFATPVDAGSMAGEAPHTIHTNAAVETLLLSAGNFSPDQVIRWGERLPDPSYNLPDNARCFRYTGIFLPEESENTNVDGYYARVLPDGEIQSYAEVTGASVPDAEPDAFRARAEARLYGGEKATAKEMQERFRSMVTFFDGYRELAQHTTVRNYPGVGQVTATTVFYQYPNDGDSENEYFCIGSCIVESPENASSGGEGWKNRKIGAHYHFNTSYRDISPSRILATTFNPQTSRSRLRALEISGFLLGWSITTHTGDTSSHEEISWTVEVGHCTDWAEGALHFFPTSEIVCIQPSQNDTGWHVLAETGIDMEDAWSRIGWSGYETAPESSDSLGHSLLIRSAGR